MPSWERNAFALAYLPASSALVLHIGLAPLPRRCFGTQRSYHLGNVTKMVSYAANKIAPYGITAPALTRHGSAELTRQQIRGKVLSPYGQAHCMALAQNSGREPHLHSETIGLANRSRSSRVYSANKKAPCRSRTLCIVAAGS